MLFKGIVRFMKKISLIIVILTLFLSSCGIYKYSPVKDDDYDVQKKFWDIYYENTTYKRFEDIPVRICSKFLSKNMYILE